jgi:hypothetical protein
MLFDKARRSFDSGVERVRWFATFVNARARAELAVFRLMADAGKLERERDRHEREIGARVFELRDRGEINVFRDASVSAAMKEIERINQELLTLKEQAAGMTGED